MDDNLKIPAPIWQQQAEEYRKPSWDGHRAQAGIPWPIFLLFTLLIAVIAALAVGLVFAYRNSPPQAATPIDGGKTAATDPKQADKDAKQPDKDAKQPDHQSVKAVQQHAEALAKQATEIEALKLALQKMIDEKNEKSPKGDEAPQKPDGQAAPAATVNLGPLKELIEKIEPTVRDTSETAIKVSKSLDELLKRQDNRLGRIESVLDNYRRPNVFEPTDIMVLACSSKEAPFATYKTAYENVLLDQVGRFSNAGLRVGLLVATGGEMKELVPLSMSLKDLENFRREFKKFSAEVSQAGDVPGALNAAQNRLDDASKAAVGVPPNARRCVLIVHGGAQPPQSGFKPERDWKNLKVDVVMLTSDPSISPDLTAWIDFCADHGGNFRPIRVETPVKGGPPAVFSPAIVDQLKTELIRLTQPILQMPNPEKKG